MSRREFLDLLARGRAHGPAVSGTPSVARRFSLAAIKDLPETSLRKMVPVRRRDMAVTILGTGVAFCSEQGEAGRIPLTRKACAAVRQFDGIRTLEEIGSLLDAEENGGQGRGFALAREAFLALSSRGIYHPASPPADEPLAAAGPSAQAVAPPPTPRARRPCARDVLMSLAADRRRRVLAALLLFAVALILWPGVKAVFVYMGLRASTVPASGDH